MSLSIRKSAGGRGTKHRTELINGDNEEYRLLFARGKETAYLECTIITEPVEYENLEKTNIQTIDIQELSKGRAELSVYPNPASDEMTVLWLNNNEAELQFIDSKGTILIGQRIRGKITLDTENIPKGLYIVRIRQGTYSVSKTVILLK